MGAQPFLTSWARCPVEGTVPGELGGGTRAGPRPLLPSLRVTIKSLGEDKQTAVGRALQNSPQWASKQGELHGRASPICVPQGTRRPESPWVRWIPGHARTQDQRPSCTQRLLQGCRRSCCLSCYCSWPHHLWLARAASAKARASASAWGPKGKRERKVILGPLVFLARKDFQVLKVCLDHRDLRALSDFRDSLAPKASGG